MENDVPTRTGDVEVKAYVKNDVQLERERGGGSEGEGWSRRRRPRSCIEEVTEEEQQQLGDWPLLQQRRKHCRLSYPSAAEGGESNILVNSGVLQKAKEELQVAMTQLEEEKAREMSINADVENLESVIASLKTKEEIAVASRMEEHSNIVLNNAQSIKTDQSASSLMGGGSVSERNYSTVISTAITVSAEPVSAESGTRASHGNPRLQSASSLMGGGSVSERNYSTAITVSEEPVSAESGTRASHGNPRLRLPLQLSPRAPEQHYSTAITISPESMSTQSGTRNPRLLLPSQISPRVPERGPEKIEGKVEKEFARTGLLGFAVGAISVSGMVSGAILTVDFGNRSTAFKVLAKCSCCLGIILGFLGQVTAFVAFKDGGLRNLRFGCPLFFVISFFTCIILLAFGVLAIMSV